MSGRNHAFISLLRNGLTRTDGVRGETKFLKDIVAKIG